MTYIARPGSLTEKAINALRAAGEPLTAMQIAKLAGCGEPSVPGILDTAVKHGAVKLDLSYGSRRWSAEPGPAAAAPTEQPAEPAQARKAASRKAKPAKAKPAPKPRHKPAKRVQARRPRAVKGSTTFVVEMNGTPTSGVATFGLFSDGTLVMVRNSQNVFTIDYAETHGLLQYLISQKNLVDQLFGGEAEEAGRPA